MPRTFLVKTSKRKEGRRCCETVDCLRLMQEEEESVHKNTFSSCIDAGDLRKDLSTIAGKSTQFCKIKALITSYLSTALL